MELEDDLRRLRWTGPPPDLRGRVLREARAPSRSRLVPPWFAALERHWLYPGRWAAGAVAAAWILILSLRVATPAYLLPDPKSLSRLTPEDMARYEVQRAQLMAELRDLFNESAPAESDMVPRTNPLPTRS
jgi:hypothetical protein